MRIKERYIYSKRHIEREILGWQLGVLLKVDVLINLKIHIDGMAGRELNAILQLKKLKCYGLGIKHI
jgi:hypothetical protein